MFFISRKGEDWVANSVRHKEVRRKGAKEIYRVNQSKDVLQNPTQLSGENVLPGFVLDLAGIL